MAGSRTLVGIGVGPTLRSTNSLAGLDVFIVQGSVFRAQRSATLAESAAELAVWAYDTSVHSLHTVLSKISSSSSDLPTVNLITAPYAGNPNLRAQEGIHLLYAYPNLRANVPAFREPFDKALGLVAQVFKDPKYGPVLVKFTLPATESLPLLRILAKRGITAATMFPGYGGAVRALEEKELWDR